MRKQLDENGNIIECDSVLLSKHDIEQMSKELFSQFNWSVENYEDTSNGISVIIKNMITDEQIDFYYYPATIRDEARNEYEKKIQLGSKNPLLHNKSKTIVLGLYISRYPANLDDIIFVGYPIRDDIRYDTNPSIRKTMVNGILQKAKLYGLYNDPNSKYVAFTYQFFYYYLKNKDILHGYKECDVASNIEPRPLLNSLSHQRIFFGAPGTGKSYKLNQEAKQYFEDNFKRVTFHPNYMYGNFIGQYKPYPAEDNHEKITYKFVPGILINQLVEALKNPDKNYLVIIEEINRANVASVFGDLFQLLDRNSNGESEYSISITKELQDYFKNEAFVDESLSERIQDKLGDDFSTLYLPNNLYIWATMNSADQGVMPMDTAFKRRWEFTYLGVNDAVDNNSDEFESYIFKVGDEQYKWNDYREQINDRLSKLNIPEDKLLGPYFLSKNVLTNEDKSYVSEVLKDKVLMYLYEDAARAFRGKLFKEGIYGTYSQLCKAFGDNPLTIFKEEIDINTINTNNTQDSTNGN
jgi:restrictase